MSTNNKLSTTRVAVIGAGSNTRQRHIPGLASQDGVEVTGVCNRTRESSQRVADEFGIPRVYTSWNQAVEDPDVDAIVIGTWPYMHAPITLAALENGKHVLCEARMAMNREEARKMLDASRAHPELVAQVVPSPFTLEHDATMARLIQEICGPLLAIEGHFSQGGFVDPDAPYTWRHDAELSGLNVMQLGIWYEALMRWVGAADGVVALGRTFVRSRPAGASSSVRYTSIPDHLSVLADMECGAQASLTVTAVTGLDRGSECWFFGEDGTVLFSNQKIFAGRRGDEQLEEQTIPDHERGCWRVEEEFLSAIRGEEPVSRTTFYEGYRYMEFTQAVQESMRTRMYVPIGA
jgi:predicted dehydrogenase